MTFWHMHCVSNFHWNEWTPSWSPISSSRNASMTHMHSGHAWLRVLYVLYASSEKLDQRTLFSNMFKAMTWTAQTPPLTLQRV